jgi:hypothetical protein
VPAPQKTQAKAAVAAEYLPATQSAQVEAVAPTAENLPATQLVQTVEAVDSE